METIKNIIEINSENIIELEKINSDLSELKSLICEKIRKLEIKKFKEKDINKKKSRVIHNLGIVEFDENTYISEDFKNKLSLSYKNDRFGDTFFDETLFIKLEYLFSIFPNLKIEILHKTRDYFLFKLNDFLYLEILDNKSFIWKNERYGKKNKILSILSVVEELKNENYRWYNNPEDFRL